MSLYTRVRNKLFPNNRALECERYLKKNPVQIKVLLAGLMQSADLGDGVISDCVSYLIKKAAKESGIKKVTVATRDIRKQRKTADLNVVRNSDILMIPGGGMIKYQVENLPVAMNRFLSRAEHYGIPAVFNAVGVEGYDGENADCRLLCEMLANYSVKGITCRDYSDFLNEKYLVGNMKATRVSDPAVWAGEVYGVSRDENSEVVGLGVAR